MKVCVVASNLAHCDQASTEFAYLEMLAESLNDRCVDFRLVYFPQQNNERESDGSAVSAFRDIHSRCLRAPLPEILPANSPHGRAARLPYIAYEFLKSADFDIVHFVGDVTSAHYYLQARRLGLLKMPARVCVHVIAPFFYRVSIGETSFTHHGDVAYCYMERCAIAMADLVCVQSRTVLQWLRQNGFDIDEAKALESPGLSLYPPVRKPRFSLTRRLRRLVFAGRLNDVKGLTTFVYATDELLRRGVDIPEVVFSGPPDSIFPSRDFVSRQTRNWPSKVRVLASDHRKEFLSTIVRHGTLVVVPPRFDGRPITVQECLALDVPLVAVDVGDIAIELDPADRDQVLCEPHYYNLADKIEQRIRQGLMVNYQSMRWEDVKANAENWGSIHKRLASLPVLPPAAPRTTRPLVSVCVAHFNRPDQVLTVLDSILAQTYDNLEVIVVDDGSTPENRKKLLQNLERYLEVRIIQQENRYLGAARNSGGRSAKGDYLLFKDDDNYAKPHEIETFVDVAERNGSDILTCFSDNFSDANTAVDANINVRRLPFGPDLLYGMFRNGYGDSNCFVRRQVWEALGGFTEHYRVGLDDHEFFTRATVSGYRIDVVPEALYFYRLSEEKMKRFHVGPNADEQRIIAPILEAGVLDPSLAPLIYLARMAVRKHGNVM